MEQASLIMLAAFMAVPALTQEEQAALSAINKHRAEHHQIRKLTVSPKLQKLAREHSAAMNDRLGMLHSGRIMNGQTECLAIAANGKQAATTLLESNAHHANLNRGNDRFAGVAVSGQYWVVVTSSRAEDAPPKLTKVPVNTIPQVPL